MGWAYNTDDDVPNCGPTISVIAIVFSIASLFAVLCRAYVRFVILKFVGPGKTTREITHWPHLLTEGILLKTTGSYS